MITKRTRMSLAAMCAAATVLASAHAAEQGNPWDEKPAPSAQKASSARTSVAKPSPAASALAARTSGPPSIAKPASKDQRPRQNQPASAATPFGAPVQMKAPTIVWGEPIALRPSAAASAPAAVESAGLAARAVAAASGPEVALEPSTRAPQTSWRLVRGMALHLQLQKWAAEAGWQLQWKLTRSWIVPADVRLNGTFDQAVEQVVQALSNEGKPISLTIWEGNNVAEINETTPR